jgi:hypothetical protein
VIVFNSEAQLDVMHCEKNICKNMSKTTFGDKDIVVVGRIWKRLASDLNFG